MTTTETPAFPVVAFVGGGNMAQALIGGLLADGWPASCIRVLEPVTALHEGLAARGVIVSDRAEQVVPAADVVVLAVKPQVMPDVVPQLASWLAERLVISIAAGINTATLSNWIQPADEAASLRLVRAMPNTPAVVQAGATGLYAIPSVNEQDRALAARILGAAGLVLWLDDEQQMHAVTAISGSGPAYFFYLMEAMLEAAQQLGLDLQAARTLTLQTALGAAQMAITSSQPPAQLRVNVTSPGGTTQAALSHLQASDVARIWQEAIIKAEQRSRELAGESA